LVFLAVKATKPIREGINNILKIADPVIVDNPPTNPSTSDRTFKKIKATKSSGNELEMALIVAPRIPGFHPRPKYSAPREIHSLESQINQLVIAIPHMRTKVISQN
jgi:hypothetical protein